MKSRCIKISSLLGVFLTILLGSVMYPFAVEAEYSLEQLRIANTLINEAGGLGKDPLAFVATVIYNQYQEQHTQYKNSKITYSDILYHSWKPGQDSNFSGSRAKFANKDKADLERMGKQRGAQNWNEALRLAGQMLNGSFRPDARIRNANAFHACNKKYTTLTQAQKCEKNSLIYLMQTPNAFQNLVFYKWNLGKFHHAYDSDVVGAVDPAYNYGASSGGSSGTDSDGEREAASCAIDAMRKMYLTDESRVDDYCWYCKIVIVLVNAYLNAASDALGATTSLGKVILKLGFLIWLAYYILQQVSSMNPVTMGKMLQEILVMGFKVALAYLAVGMGGTLIRDYYLNPIIGTGVDYGMAIFKGMGI